jgi:2-keto-4-pentenoate hydratase/2-oxohepta-3-ene-1,7-dioic acid hydratase in catechol pathway
MKLVSFTADSAARIGILEGDQIVDLSEVHRLTGCFDDKQATALGNMVSLIKQWDEVRPAIAECLAISDKQGMGRHALGSVKMAAPMIPSTILCSGSNYLSHNQEKVNADISGKEPEFFVKTGDCVIGTGDPIIHDKVLTQKLDGEVELAIVIGKAGRHIPIERALDHVFGYTIVNDVTARDRQVRCREDGSYWYELGRGKLFDTSAPMGPCITTADEIGDPQTLSVKSWVNGELRQISNTSQMIWSCAQLIHFFSINMTLKPGMVIITGTPSGTAWSTDAELGGKWRGVGGMIPATGYLKHGDLISCEVEKIGRLDNPVV